MSNYRRSTTPGASYFFTVITHRRRPIFCGDSAVQLLREAFRQEIQNRPFEVQAMVVLPDHLHCIWKLPPGDSNFSGRWREIKKRVSKNLTTAQNARHENDVWQRRFWEHQIRNEHDWRVHMDYIHYNPVKHGYVGQPSRWRWSSFHRWMERGYYDANWGIVEPNIIRGLDFE